jgi:hypothetical protein
MVSCFFIVISWILLNCSCFNILFLTQRWNGEKDSLSATLYQARPDVFPVSFAHPIPTEIPLIPFTVCLPRIGALLSHPEDKVSNGVNYDGVSLRRNALVRE